MIEQKYLQQLNSWKNYEYNKFKPSNGFTIPDIHYLKEDFNTESKNAVVYCIFYRIGYLKYCLISILSQILYTDITNYNIYIITDQDHYDLVVNTIGKIVPEENIIISPVPFKYYAFHLDEIKRLEKVILMDSDGFIMGTYKDELYKRVFAQETTLFGYDGGIIDDLLPSKIEGASQEIKDFIDVDFICSKVGRQFWGLNGFSLHHIKNIDLENIPSLFWENEFICDETILLNNYVKKNIPFEYSNKYVNWVMKYFNAFEYFCINIDNDNREEPSFVHPIVGPTLDDKIVNLSLHIFTIICQNYAQYSRRAIRLSESC